MHTINRIKQMLYNTDSLWWKRFTVACSSCYLNFRNCAALVCNSRKIYSTARFKLYAHEYILASANIFSPSSQPMLASKVGMLASKGNMLSIKGNMLSCIVLLGIKIDTRVQLLARIQHRAVNRCTRARLHALVYYFTRDLNLMLTDITHQEFIKCLLAILIHDSKVHASTSITLQSYRVLAGSSHYAYHFKNPTFFRKVQVTLPLSFCHVLKCPKDRVEYA